MAAAVLALILLVFPPSRYGAFYPQCPIHRYLHLLCPGCGGTRALAALLHGDWREALRLNTLVTLLIPAWPAVWIARRCRPELRVSHRLRPLLPAVALAVTVVFGVLRNLPPFVAR